MPAPRDRRSGLGFLLLVALLAPVGLGVGWLMGHLKGNAPVAPASLAGPAAGTPEPVPVEAWPSYADALVESRASGKPVLLDFNAEWCPPCQAMKRSVFENAALAGEVRSVVIPVSVVDRQREEGANRPDVTALQRKFRVDVFPTLVVVNPATGRREVARGFGDPDRMVAWIREAAARVR
jgi:protein disulfide-isomerase